jgi:hypothetical protein
MRSPAKMRSRKNGSGGGQCRQRQLEDSFHKVDEVGSSVVTAPYLGKARFLALLGGTAGRCQAH